MRTEWEAQFAQPGHSDGNVQLDIRPALGEQRMGAFQWQTFVLSQIGRRYRQHKALHTVIITRYRLTILSAIGGCSQMVGLFCRLWTSIVVRVSPPADQRKFDDRAA